MAIYVFAQNECIRNYYEVEAESLDQARKLLEDAPFEFYVNALNNDETDQPFDLVDIEGAE